MNQRLMSLKFFTVVTVCSLIGLGTLPAMAQSSPTNTPLQDFKQDDPNDPNQVFTNRGGTGSLLNLINRLQQVNGRSNSEFAEDQAESFDSAVEAFRQKQQQELGNPTETGSESIDTPEAVNVTP